MIRHDNSVRGISIRRSLGGAQFPLRAVLGPQGLPAPALGNDVLFWLPSDLLWEPRDSKQRPRRVQRWPGFLQLHRL